MDSHDIPGRTSRKAGAALSYSLGFAALLVASVAVSYGADTGRRQSTRTTISVGVTVPENCSAVLDSTGSLVAASYACLGQANGGKSPPSITSTSMALVASTLWGKDVNLPGSTNPACGSASADDGDTPEGTQSSVAGPGSDKVKQSVDGGHGSLGRCQVSGAVAMLFSTNGPSPSGEQAEVVTITY